MWSVSETCGEGLASKVQPISAMRCEGEAWRKSEGSFSQHLRRNNHIARVLHLLRPCVVGHQGHDLGKYVLD